MCLKKVLLAFLCLFMYSPSLMVAQGNFSEQIQAYQQSEGKERISAANQVMKKLYDENFIDEAPHFSRATPLDSMDKKLYFAAAEYSFYELGDFKNTIVYAQKVVDICVAAQDVALEGECQSMMAVAYFRMAQYTQALRHAHRDLTLQKMQGNTSNQSSALNTLAGIYLASKQYEEAFKYISAAIPLSRAARDSSRIAIQLGMGAEILQAMHRSEEALVYAREAYAIDSTRKNFPKAAIRVSQMVSALMDLQRNEEAEQKLALAIPVLQQAGIRQSLSICHNQMGELLLRRGANTEAAAHFSQSLPFFVAIGDKYNEAKARAGAYKALRDTDPQQAMLHLERLSSLKDSLYTREMQQELSMAHAKYHNEELQLQNAHERKVKLLTLATSLAVVLTLSAVLAFVVFALRNRKRRWELMRQLQEEKEMFFTNITHEFRTPLTIILGLAERMRQNKLDPEESTESVATIIARQGKALLDLVNQLLDIARTERMNITADYRTDDVVGFIHMVVEACEELAHQKHIALQYVPQETQVKMKFVPDFLQKIVQNLVANALKFTPDYGNVRVSTQLSPDGKSFRIAVTDNGEGIAPDFLPYVFDTFTGRKGTNGETSTGVGLALVKKLVESLGGQVSAESEEGKGSTFVVVLPCERGAEVDEKPLLKTAKSSVPMSAETAEEIGAQKVPSTEITHSILIVEDNVDVYYYMEHVLKGEHYALYHARNGKDGFEKAQAVVPDLIVTDVMMPVMDGFEMCQLLKNSEITNHIPVVVVTARNSEADKLHGLDCGAECYLQKPFSAEELLTRVRNIFERRRIWREKFAAQLTQPGPETANQQDFNMAENQFMSKVNDYIFAHMEEGPIGVEDLASHMCMSPKQLNRKLPNIVGYSVSVYIVQQRVARACRLLESTEERINVIAQKCGFDNPSNFSRTFKETMDCSPSEWRFKGKNK